MPYEQFSNFIITSVILCHFFTLLPEPATCSFYTSYQNLTAEGMALCKMVKFVGWSKFCSLLADEEQ